MFNYRPIFLWLYGLFAFTGLLFFGVTESRAHSTGESYLVIDVETNQITGRVELNVKDLLEHLNIDVGSLDAGVTGVIQKTSAQVEAVLMEHFSLGTSNDTFDIQFVTNGLLTGESEKFVQYHFIAKPHVIPDVIHIRYDMFMAQNSQHRGLLLLESNAKTSEEYGYGYISLVFGPGSSEQALDLQNVTRLRGSLGFVWQGVWHIWIGTDHILFLLTLLLPAVLLRKEGTWKPLASFKHASWRVIKIVTLFTIAHSITLTLAALGVVSLSTQWVETIIALSVVFVALNNIWPVFNEKSWLLIFGFGLFHGLGFAVVMGHLQFRMMDLIKTMIAFNIGVEFGQLAIVIVAYPILYALRKYSWYATKFMPACSLIIALLAAVWVVQRAFGL